MNTEIKYEAEIKEFISELDSCLKKFRESTKGEMYPIIVKTDYEITQLNRVGFFDYTKDDFLPLSSSHWLTIRDWKKPMSQELDNFITYKSDKLSPTGK